MDESEQGAADLPNELRLYTIPQVATMLSCSHRHVYNLIDNGTIPAVNNIVGRKRIRYTDLMTALEDHAA